MRPYPVTNDKEQRFSQYGLARVRRVIANTFGSGPVGDNCENAI